MRITLLFPAFAFVAAMLCNHIANAYEFYPTDSEWQRWPGHCKAKYVWNVVGRNSKFANQVNQSHRQQLKLWEDAGVRGLHHYCTGTIWLNRARTERDALQKKYMLRNARNETLFTFERSNESAPQFAYVAIQMATIMLEQGEIEHGLRILNSTIDAQPKNDVLYSAAAVMQKRLGRIDSAKDTLLRGHEAVDGNSAEICYNLGLLYLELGDLDASEKYASLAYEMGFPLPGLRAKLQRLGRM